MAQKKTSKKTTAKRGRPKGTIPPNAGKGRKKGTPNVITKTVKDAIAGALNAGDGAQEFFEQLKQDDPRAFATIAAKLIPVQVDLDAKVDNSVTVEIVKK
jgi:hypothetical protein